jgi:hypothetical protein
MKSILLAVGCAVTSLSVAAQSLAHNPLQVSSQIQEPVGVASETQYPVEITSGIQSSMGVTTATPRPDGVASNHARLGVASDWTQHHVLFPASKSLAVTTRLQSDPRYTQSYLLRHGGIWWPEAGRGRLRKPEPVFTTDLAHRDWSEPLGFTGPSYVITGITQTGTTVTVTTNIDHVFVTGQVVIISGVSAGTGGCTSAAAAAIDGVQTLTAAPGYFADFTFTSTHIGSITGGQCTLAANAAAVGPTPFEPVFDFSFNVADADLETGFGALNAVNLSDENNSSNGGADYYAGYMATAGTMTLTDNGETGAPLETYPQLLSAANPYIFIDSLLFPNYPNTTLPFDDPGIAFTDSSLNEYQMLIGTYEVDGEPTLELWTGYYVDGTFIRNGRGILPSTVFNTDPGGGQTYPAKYTFDVTAAPSCADDYVAIGIPANAVTGAQANIVGYNNLYTPNDGTDDTCTGTGPTVKFAYASGIGEVPGSVSLSLDGTQLAYIEDLLAGSSVFHVLTIGTGSEGTSPTSPATPGANGSTAVDTTLALSSGSCAAQSSTTSPFIRYTTNDAYPDSAYVTTYAWTGAGTGTGCLYKIGPIFSGGAPTVAWSIPISAVPSSPVYDATSNNVFFTDSSGNIDYVTDTGTPSGYTSLPVAAGATSENPPTVDSTDEMVYATFNTNGTDALVVQVPITGGGALGTAVSVPVGLGNTLFTGPYGVDFSNAWYTSGPTAAGALLYVAGTDTATGTVPTLYSVGFGGVTPGVMDTTTASSTALATSTNTVTGDDTIADASSVTEFYNATTTTDYLFVGVTDGCGATAGGTAGCVMSLNITGGAPSTVTTATALAALGGTTGLVVDNDASTTPVTGYPQASSVYYGTKDGGTLVKATQSGLD